MVSSATRPAGLEEVRLGELQLSALRRSGPGPRVLALHGWLDNAHSFLPLIEHLSDCELVLLDLPGHGRSPHRPAGARYHFDDFVFDVAHTLDALDWPQCHLLGHSLGGAVSSVLAAGSPERVQSLALIEGLGPISGAADQTTVGWRRAVQRSQLRPRRVHPSLSAAIAARTQNSDLDPACARLLAERGVVAADDGFVWAHDGRLSWPSTQRYTETQVLDLLGGIEAPVLNIYSEPASGILPAHVLQRRLASLRKHRLFCTTGGHHLHMHQADLVGPVIKEFFHGQA